MRLTVQKICLFLQDTKCLKSVKFGTLGRWDFHYAVWHHPSPKKLSLKQQEEGFPLPLLLAPNVPMSQRDAEATAQLTQLCF